MRQRSWSDSQLRTAVKTSRSMRSVIQKLGLIPAGGNYAHITGKIRTLNLDTVHFTGQGWLKGIQRPYTTGRSLKEVLKRSTVVSSFKLKRRLYNAGLKTIKCEECGWAKKSEDGRIPLELDHINGDHQDNRIGNLRVLCPNCHSLKPTHRGRNKKRRGGGTGYTRDA